MRYVLTLIVGVVGLSSFGHLGTSIGDTIAGASHGVVTTAEGHDATAHRDVKTSTPTLTRRSSGALLSGLRGLISPSLSFVRGAAGTG